MTLTQRNLEASPHGGYGQTSMNPCAIARCLNRDTIIKRVGRGLGEVLASLSPHIGVGSLVAYTPYTGTVTSDGTILIPSSLLRRPSKEALLAYHNLPK